MSENTKVLHFSISGEFIADIARTRFTEGDYQAGLNILEQLEGLALEDQIAILRGKKTLIGMNSNIELVEGSPELIEEMEQWHKQTYSSVFKYKNKYYTPYAYVTSWSRDDLPTEESVFSHVSHQIIDDFEEIANDKMYDKGYNGFLKGHLHSRSLYYADNPEKDFAIRINDKVKKLNKEAVVLFKEVTEQLPLWATSYYSKDPYEAINKKVEYSYDFKEVGARYYFDDNDYQHSFTEEPKENTIDIEDEEYQQRRQQFIEDYKRKSEEERYLEEEKRIEAYKQKIIENTNNDKEYGWKELIDETSDEYRSIKVPYRAFLHFAIDRAHHEINNIQVELPPYTPVCPVGLKLLIDNPIHTDCWLGAGLDLDKAYDMDTWEHKLFFRKMFEYQDFFYSNFEFNVLNGAKKTDFTGTTVNIHNYKDFPKGQRILVLPHLGVEFETVALECDAIITETGGKLAHLSIVGREFGIPIIRIDNSVIGFSLPKEYNFDLINGTFTEIKSNKPKVKI